MFDYAIDRITTITGFATRNCLESNCGQRDKDGELLSCTTAKCGERRIEEHLQRELLVMRSVRKLLEALERKEIEGAASAGKQGKR